MGWACPLCKSTSLGVTVITSATLSQFADGNFETSVDGDHEWDASSTMWCRDCGHCTAAALFDHRPSPEEILDT